MSLKRIAEWVERYRRFWEASLNRLDEYLRDVQSKEKTRERKPREK